jgi:hypothetical protein
MGAVYHGLCEDPRKLESLSDPDWLHSDRDRLVPASGNSRRAGTGRMRMPIPGGSLAKRLGKSLDLPVIL